MFSFDNFLDWVMKHFVKPIRSIIETYDFITLEIFFGFGENSAIIIKMQPDL